MQNINQYKFNILPCSQVILTEKLYERLECLVGRSAWIASEHACYFYGKEISENVLFFDEMNLNEDYENTGTNSINPLAYSVGPGKGKLNEEIEKKIESMQSGVIADIHTHPSGVYESESEKDDFRFFSTGDIETSLSWNNYLKRKNPNLQHISGLLGVDRINGNISISFIWFNSQEHKFYRFNDIAIAKDIGDNYAIESLEKVGEIQLLSKNWSNDFALSQIVKDNLIGLKNM